MASVRVTGAGTLPDAVCKGLATALVHGLLPSKHVLDNGHVCGRSALEMGFAPDSASRAGFENFEALAPIEQQMVLRAEAASWSQLRRIRTGRTRKSRTN